MSQLTPERAADFARCRRQVLEESFFQHGIGSLSERESHAILKNFYCPDPSCQEINIGGFVADISDSNGITDTAAGNTAVGYAAASATAEDTKILVKLDG